MFKKILWFLLGAAVFFIVWALCILFVVLHLPMLQSLPMGGTEVLALIFAVAVFFLWKKRRALAVGIISGIFAVMVLQGSILLGGRPPVEGQDVSHWASVQGTVQNIRFWGPQPGDLGGCIIYYTYSVGGQNYKFKTFRYISDIEQAKQVVAAFPNGSSIEVKYDPKRPQESYVLRLNPVLLD